MQLPWPAFFILCLSLQAWGSDDDLVAALEEHMEFTEYAGGIITPDQVGSLGLEAFHLVDTRSKDLFAQGHMPGAVNVEWREVVARRAEMPGDRPVILYCDTGLLSSRAHFALRLLGYANVKVLFGGYNGWLLRQASGNR
jgi:rhodanese-related sulfurtransferase